MTNSNNDTQKISRRDFVKVGASSAAGLLLASCAPSATPEPVSNTVAPAAPTATSAPVITVPKEIRYVLNQSVTTLDPQLHVMRVFESVLRNCYEPLVQRSHDMLTIEPALAVSWEQIDELTMRFKLREGVTFHNGEPFNANSVKFSIDRILDEATGAPYRMSRYGNMAPPVVVEEYIIDVKTIKPDPVLLSRMTGWHMCMIPPEYFKEKGAEAFAQEPNGTGPFKFVEWVRDGAITFEANPNYWRGAPKVEKIIFRSVPENQARVAALRSGEADIITHMPPDDISTIERDDNLTFKTVPSTGILFGQIYYTKPPTDNKLVRQALNYAIDVDSLIENVLAGYAIRIPTALPEFVWGYDPSIQPYSYDPEKSKELLKEAGFPDGVEIIFDSVQGRYLKDKELAQAMTGMLEKAGFKVTLNLYEVSRVWDMQLKGEIGHLSIWGWGNQMFDADDTLYPEFKSFPDSTQQRESDFDPEIDEWVNEARVSIDPERRKELYSKVQERIKENAPWIFMFQQVDIYGVRKSLPWDPRSDENSWLYAVGT
jgi:peptide/nickel transport system substrate-binding protein